MKVSKILLIFGLVIFAILASWGITVTAQNPSISNIVTTIIFIIILVVILMFFVRSGKSGKEKQISVTNEGQEQYPEQYATELSAKLNT